MNTRIVHVAQLLQMKGKIKQENAEMFDNTLRMINNLCERYEEEKRANIWNTNLNNRIGEPNINFSTKLLVIIFVYFSKFHFNK